MEGVTIKKMKALLALGAIENYVAAVVEEMKLHNYAMSGGVFLGHGR